SNISLIYKHTNVYRFGSKDLWNISVINSSGQNYQARLVADITSGGQKILTAQSSNISIISGVSNVNPMDVATVSINYYDRNSEESDRSSISLLPGEYDIHISLIDVATNALLEDLNEKIKVEILTPITLLSPEDESIIYTKNPQFSWLPPQPLPAGEIHYQIRIAEILNGQSAADAMMRNRPIHDAIVNSQTLYNYPLNTLPLIENKDYAWEVRLLLANSGEGSRAKDAPIKSDIWRFRIEAMKPNLEIKIKENSYVDIKTASSTNVYWMMDTLRLKYNERLASGTASIIIKNLKSETIYSQSSVLDLKGGDNRINTIVRKIYFSRNVFGLSSYSRFISFQQQSKY
ncbi:MAG: hypothetical protein HYZ42_13730, partial [Bacteroidetes bacterium]|nr:hypothetical protein [Bacteroidota bacterium]